VRPTDPAQRTDAVVSDEWAHYFDCFGQDACATFTAVVNDAIAELGPVLSAPDRSSGDAGIDR
jgi:hypothetical protein